MSCAKIGILSFKGGVAKTSSAVNIAAGIKNKNPTAKVLLVDADPQGSVRSYFQLCLLYTSPSPRDRTRSRMPSSA